MAGSGTGAVLNSCKGQKTQGIKELLLLIKLLLIPDRGAVIALLTTAGFKAYFSPAAPGKFAFSRAQGQVFLYSGDRPGNVRGNLRGCFMYRQEIWDLPAPIFNADCCPGQSSK